MCRTPLFLLAFRLVNMGKALEIGLTKTVNHSEVCPGVPQFIVGEISMLGTANSSPPEKPVEAGHAALHEHHDRKVARQYACPLEAQERISLRQLE